MGLEGASGAELPSVYPACTPGTELFPWAQGEQGSLWFLPALQDVTSFISRCLKGAG